MANEMSPHECAECKVHELHNSPLGEVAKHWLLAHPTYLDVLRAAVTIYQAQESGALRRG